MVLRPSIGKSIWAAVNRRASQRWVRNTFWRKRVDEVGDETKTREKSARRAVMKHFQMEYSSKDEPAKRRGQRKSNQMMQREGGE